MPQTSFLYLRHGQTDWNVEGRKQGHTDIPLNATGLEQARTAAQKLRGQKLDAIVTSPLLRAHKTAQFVADATGAPLHIEPLLIERSFGSFEGKTEAEMHALGLIPENTDWSLWVPEDAEQWDATLTRARTTIAKWVNNAPDQTILFVGHGAFFRALYESLGGPYFRLNNATPYRFHPGEPSWSLEEIF